MQVKPPNYPVGMRAFAIRDIDHQAKKINIFGHGVYAGDHKPNRVAPSTNPRIDLDSGETVWGYMCWWGPEERLHELIAREKATDYEMEEVEVPKVPTVEEQALALMHSLLDMGFTREELTDSLAKAKSKAERMKDIMEDVVKDILSPQE
jgi:hypothetical protein